MCIYCGTKKYRKIYEFHHGPIPTDELGRSYEIHHIDGNHHNNSPDNLKCVTIKEHYDIHYSQGDYGACFYISRKMQLDVSESAALMSLANKKKVAEGRHNLQKRSDGSSISSDRVKDGTHPLLGKGINHVKVDKTLYKFEHKITKEKVCLTQYEFVRAYKLHQSQVSRLIRGKAKSTGKWVYVGLG